MDFILGENRDKTGDIGYIIMAIFIIVPTLLLWLVIFTVGAARLAYNTHSSIILAGLAFVLSPLYYIYHGFTK
jgi:hypothetical protein